MHISHVLADKPRLDLKQYSPLVQSIWTSWKAVKPLCTQMAPIHMDQASSLRLVGNNTLWCPTAMATPPTFSSIRTGDRKGYADSVMHGMETILIGIQRRHWSNALESEKRHPTIFYVRSATAYSRRSYKHYALLAWQPKMFDLFCIPPLFTIQTKISTTTTQAKTKATRGF